jgi:hypothetical protein
MNCTLDHLVVGAATLAQGAAWCEATLGVVPAPGGRHALMGTHNRLLSIASEAFPRCYLEIIAIDPEAPAPQRPRWFGLDDAALQATLQRGPRLLHAVLRSPDIGLMRAGLINRGCHPGQLVAAERATPDGLLRWQILLREDGQIDCGGELPTLIAWDGELHPADRLPASGVTLAGLQARELPSQAREVLRWRGPSFLPPPAPLLQARLNTPLGEVSIASA